MAMNGTPRVGLVGWRGMVGSVLMDRMAAEGDFALIEPVFFSTSNAGGKAPMGDEPLADAFDLQALKSCASDSRFRKDPSGQPAKLYWNATGGSLSDTFKEIGNELSNLRIVS